MYSVEQTRRIECLAQQQLPEHTLMQRAGLAVARLTMAVAPHAQRIWIACGSGNNGGDGMQAALHLLRWGKQPIVSWLGQPELAPADALMAYEQLVQAGIVLQTDAPDDFDFGIDALLGIGTRLREPTDRMADWIHRLNVNPAKVLAVDVPTGLCADSGQVTKLHVRADDTLSLLTLKPGLFTASGRDVSATVWFDTLGVDAHSLGFDTPRAKLLAKPPPALRFHASHKGSYGDVAVVGGASSMVGAALLAARAALHAGAGRVFVALLDGGALPVDPLQPELMFRAVDAIDWSHAVAVLGCGAGQLPAHLIEHILSIASPIVIDADAINSIASNTTLQALLRRRADHSLTSVLTPHPLEAARLLGCSTAQVQGNRLAAAQTLSQRFACTVALKGSGTIIGNPARGCVINPTGNATLATAGTGDVLSGMVGAALAQGLEGFDATCRAVYRHGEVADKWSERTPLTASTLAHSGN